MKQPIIYICEDDLALGESIQKLLIAEGYLCELFFEGSELDERMIIQTPDALLLDYQLPGEDGITIAQKYCQALPRLRAIIMSVKNDQRIRSQGYSAGAMLYLSKPFEPESLLACLRGVFGSGDAVEPITLWVKSRQLVIGEQVLPLTVAEIRVLSCLALHQSNVVEYFQLMTLLNLPLDDDLSRARLEVVVSRLRKKLKACNTDYELNIRNKQKFGYFLDTRISIVN